MFKLTLLDIAIIIVFLISVVGIGAAATRRANRNICRARARCKPANSRLLAPERLFGAADEALAARHAVLAARRVGVDAAAGDDHARGAGGGVAATAADPEIPAVQF